ncbi:MAG: hypothetical protein GF328_15545, partial [Candidatus Latescibacteria bacterium]|nr:hypothetical protein [Candidatus Latescibacterota bacterium]
LTLEPTEEIVTNEAQIEIYGDGEFTNLPDENSTEGFVNNGTFTAKGGSNLDFGSGQLENNGTFTVSEGGEVRAGEFDNDGSAIINGDLYGDLAWFATGYTGGEGTINGNAIGGGEGAPGNSAGVLTITGAYEQLDTGLLSIELAGTDPASVDRLAVGGQAMLAGSLRVMEIEGFTAAVGDSFTILTCGSRSGTFDSLLTECLDSGACLSLAYTDTSVVAAVTSQDPSSVEEEASDPDEGVENEDPPARLALRSRGFPGRSGSLVLDLPAGGAVDLAVFDPTGRRVATPATGRFPAGQHVLDWAGTDDAGNALAAGVYFVRAAARDGATATIRVVVAR